MKKACTLLVTMFSLGCYGHKTTVNIPMPPGLKAAPTSNSAPPLTNGHEDQATMANDESQFDQSTTFTVEGPFMNNVGCSSCHFNPTSGGNSAVFEHRVGPKDMDADADDNVASATLIHAGATPGNKQQVAPDHAANALRRSLSLFGDGYVEMIPDTLMMDIARQNGGQYVMVPVLESPGSHAVGKFGWKDQEPTLLSFAGDAAFNELGEGNRLVVDPQNGIEDNDNPTAARPEDIDNYNNFMQSLQLLPKGTQTVQTIRGRAVFVAAGCAWCHVQTLYTKPFQPQCWPSGCSFEPFSDYLLHDIGTGDGIQQGPAPPNKMRTAPLSGVSHLDRFIHDGRVFTIREAIEAHKKEANFSRKNFKRLTQSDQQAMLAFLSTL